MAAALDRKAERAIDFRPHIIVIRGQFCQRGRDIKHGESLRRRAQVVAGRHRQRAKPLEDFQLQPECAVASVGDSSLDLAELSGGEPDLPG